MKKRALGMFTRSAQARDLRENGRIILAHGEVTGHHHEVVIDDSYRDAARESAFAAVERTNREAWQNVVPALDYFEELDGTRVLLVTRPCLLTHQEHAPIALDPGNPVPFRQGDVFGQPIGHGAWKITRQNEYTPQAIRQVMD